MLLQTMIRKNMLLLGSIWITLMLIMLSGVSFAQPAQTRIIDNVWIEPLDGEYIVHVSFIHPLQYINHFPQDAGDELRIKLRSFVLNKADKGFELGRESVRPKSSANVDLIEIAYEGDFSDTPFLILNFRNTHRFEVETGGDSRSLIILVKPNKAP